MLRKGILLTILVSLSVWYYFEHLVIDNSQKPTAAKQYQATKAVPTSHVVGVQRPFYDISFKTGFPRAYPRPESRWKSREKEQYQKLLMNGKYDTMLVPFQVHGYALDRATRSLMTAELSYALSHKTKLKLPDPYLLSRALGEGERQYNISDVNQLAKRMGIKKIIWAHVGHYRKNKMNLVIQYIKTGQVPYSNINPGPGKKVFSNVPFSDEKPPIEVYHSMLPEILAALNVEINERQKEGLLSQKQESFFLPENPMDIFSDNVVSYVQNAYYFQLLAYLTPSHDERSRERLIEKSILNIYKISPSVPEYRALKARAYMQLGLRPAAIAVLGAANTNEEKSILAALNGNLPDLLEFKSHIKTRVGRLLSELDANKIAAYYP